MSSFLTFFIPLGRCTPKTIVLFKNGLSPAIYQEHYKYTKTQDNLESQ